MRYGLIHSQILIAIIFVTILANIVIYSQLYMGTTTPTGATVSALCGNNEIDPDYPEECDGIDDALCPDYCRSDCTCPPTYSRQRASVSNYRQTFFFGNLTQNETIKINATDTKLAFVSISFFMPNSTNNMTFFVESNISKSDKVRAPTGIAYEYMNISYKCNDTKVEDFTIEYRVNKSWIIKNNIDYNTITLAYNKDWNLWLELATNHTRETDYHHYFSSFYSGPGTFAVTGYKVPEPAPLAAPTIPYCGNGKIEINETSENCCVDVACSTGYYCNKNNCEKYSLCGNNNCDYNETITNCPQDCARQMFFSPVYWLFFIGVIALAVIGFLLLSEDYKEVLKPRKPTPLMVKFSPAQ